MALKCDDDDFFFVFALFSLFVLMHFNLLEQIEEERKEGGEGVKDEKEGRGTKRKRKGEQIGVRKGKGMNGMNFVILLRIKM